MTQARYVFQKTYSILCVTILSACSLDGLVNVDNPEGGVEVTPEYLRSRAGATGMFYGALGDLQAAVSEISLDVAFFTDELTCRTPDGVPRGVCSKLNIDARIGSIDPLGRKLMSTSGYAGLQEARIGASQSRSLILDLGDSALTYMVSGGYAVEGYSILLLAENICSGIPLSKVPFEGVVQYDAGVSTNEAFRRAISHFDSALAIEHDSLRYYSLASIGKARAFLGMGLYDSAFAAVDGVITTDLFGLTYTQNDDPAGARGNSSFWAGLGTALENPINAMVVIDNGEGSNGLVWSRPGFSDPRVPVLWNVVGIDSLLHQRKYQSRSMVFPLARGVEAVMIRAEYLLNRGDAEWIEHINAARRSVMLNDTTDPGTWQEQVDLLFRERAFWFYLEGNRLADYRRLVRQYQRNPHDFYPGGIYIKNQGVTPFYGTELVFTPPGSEYDLNYKYEGCIHNNP